MTLPDAAAVHAAVAATWPAASLRELGPFVIREGRGGGSRVSAATATGPVSDSDLPLAEAAMRDLGQVPLFMIRETDAVLDTLLAARGYAVMDPVLAYAASIAHLSARPAPPVTTFEVWPPLAVQQEIWAEAGIGPARLAIMDRARGARMSILGRVDDAPAGTAFVACDGALSMLHAVEVRAAWRRRGLGSGLVRAAAGWAARQGADHLTLMVTQANMGARGLYEAVGMVPVAGYHYRILQDGRH
jgi:GNAT superfamily N-acetyltransferase